MGDHSPEIRLYGAARCHKTQYYMELMDSLKAPYVFMDVEKNEDYARELRLLYENGKLNFPTLRVGDKRLRNPSEKEMLKWLSPYIDSAIQKHKQQWDAINAPSA